MIDYAYGQIEFLLQKKLIGLLTRIRQKKEVEEFTMNQTIAFDDKYISFLSDLAADKNYNIKKMASKGIVGWLDALKATDFDRQLATQELTRWGQSDDCDSLPMRMIVILHAQAELNWKKYQEIRAAYNELVGTINNYRQTVDGQFYDGYIDYFRGLGYDSSKVREMAQQQMRTQVTQNGIRDVMKKVIAEFQSKLEKGKPLQMNNEYWCEEWKEEETQYFFGENDEPQEDYLDIAGVLRKKGTLTTKEELAVTYVEAILRRDGIVDKTLRRAHDMVDCPRVTEQSVGTDILRERRELVDMAKSFVASADADVIVLKDGTVMLYGEKPKFPNLQGMDGVKKIISLGYDDGVAVLKTDGTVCVEAKNWSHDMKELDRTVTKWSNIVDIVETFKEIAALTGDGRVLCAEAGSYHDKGKWKSADGWSNIKQIAASANHLVALKNNGTVVACGSNEHGECRVSHWRNIVAVACDNVYVDIGGKTKSYGFTLGLTEAGEVLFAGDVAPGREREHRAISQWRNVVQINSYASNIQAVTVNGEVRETGYSSVSKYYYTDTHYDDIPYEAAEADDYPEDETDIPLTERSDILVAKESLGVTMEGVVASSDICLFSDLEELKQMEEESRESSNRARKVAQYRQMHLCQHCGGRFKGLFKKKCVNCGRPMDY